MTKTALILGAKGRFGRAMRDALEAAGWTLRLFARSWEGAKSPHTLIAGNASDAGAVARAAEGVDVIVNALNPKYHEWAKLWPPMTRAVIGAAKKTGATILLCENVYLYGEHSPEVLAEDTPTQPTTRKGALRVKMLDQLRAAAEDGVQTLVLRAGDFLDTEKGQDWFSAHMAARVYKGKFVYPGPLDRVHAWAFLPDLGRAMVGLAERRHQLGPFEVFCFESFNLTGAELTEALSDVTGRSLRTGRFPWGLVSLVGLWNAEIREVQEMRYLWTKPHRVDGTRLRQLLPEYRPTPLGEALRAATRPLAS